MVRQATKLYIGNLPEATHGPDLQVIFEKYGKVEECDIVKNYGFVHMSNDDEAKVAVDALNNSDFMGSKITVEVSHSKVRPRPGMGGKGQCYRCGRQGHWSKECPRNPSARLASSSMPQMMGPQSGSFMDRPMGRFGPDRGMDSRFPPDRGFGMDRGYGAERMRPYPDPYERRIPPAGPTPGARDDYFSYYRRSYDDYGYARRSPPRFMNNSFDRGYDFTEDRSNTWSGGRGQEMMPSSGMQS